MSASELEAAAQEWERIAAEKVAWGDYEASRGRHAPAAYNLATACKRTADALRLQIETGEWHCVCCLKPMTFHNGYRI